MTEGVSESFKKRESLRCLFASVASMEIIDWLLKSGQLGAVAVNAYEIDQRLTNIRLFFLSGWGLARQEAERNFVPMGSPLTNVVTRRLARREVCAWCGPRRRTWAPVGSPVGPPAVWQCARPAADTVSRSILRRRPRTPGHSAAWCR